jgi:hypothetical protein
MENVKNNETLDNTNAFFDYSFETLDLNKDMEKLYEIISDDYMQDEFEQKIFDYKARLNSLFATGRTLEETISDKLGEIKYE